MYCCKFIVIYLLLLLILALRLGQRCTCAHSELNMHDDVVFFCVNVHMMIIIIHDDINTILLLILLQQNR